MKASDKCWLIRIPTGSWRAINTKHTIPGTVYYTQDIRHAALYTRDEAINILIRRFVYTAIKVEI